MIHTFTLALNLKTLKSIENHQKQNTQEYRGEGSSRQTSGTCKFSYLNQCHYDDDVEDSSPSNTFADSSLFDMGVLVRLVGKVPQSDGFTFLVPAMMVTSSSSVLKPQRERPWMETEKFS